MDVTSAIKINELSQELLKKGMAASSEEASAMAEKFLKREIVHANKKPSFEGSTEEKNDLLIERMQRQVNSAFTSMDERMKLMASQIDMLRNEISMLKKSRLAGAKEIKIEAPEEDKEPQKKLPQTDEKSSEMKNQRVGKLKPGDVSIEEFFYCGEKKNA